MINFFRNKDKNNLDVNEKKIEPETSSVNVIDFSYKEKLKDIIINESNEKLSFMKKVENLYNGISDLHFEWVDGYKIISSDLKGYGNYQYEVGKKEYLFDIPILCKTGFHFSKTIDDCLKYKDLYNGNRIFKVKGFVLKNDSGECISFSEKKVYDECFLSFDKIYISEKYDDKLCASIIIIEKELDIKETFINDILNKFNFLKYIDVNIDYDEIKSLKNRNDLFLCIIKNIFKTNNFKESFINIFIETMKDKYDTYEYNNDLSINLLIDKDIMNKIIMICLSDMSKELKQFSLIRELYK